MHSESESRSHAMCDNRFVANRTWAEFYSILQCWSVFQWNIRFSLSRFLSIIIISLLLHPLSLPQLFHSLPRLVLIWRRIFVTIQVLMNGRNKRLAPTHMQSYDFLLPKMWAKLRLCRGGTTPCQDTKHSHIRMRCLRFVGFVRLCVTDCASAFDAIVFRWKTP